MENRNTLIAWLNDAHGLERAIAQLLQRQAQSTDDQEVRGRLRWHLEETDRHAEMVKRCIEQLNGTVSTTKSAVGAAAGFLQGLMGWMPDDALVKNLLADYAAEQFEIASYKALIVAAQTAGEPQIAETCQQILLDEERMAQWIDERLPHVIRSYLMDHVEARR